MGLKDDIQYMKWNIIIHSCLKPPTSDGFLALFTPDGSKVFTHGLRIPSDSLSESLPVFGGCNDVFLWVLG